MRSPLSLLFAAFVILGSAGASPEPRELFNGHNLDGWIIENSGQFSVKNGHLHVDRGTGWLRSKDTFVDFVLTYEVRFLENRANSGIFVRTGSTSHDDENGWPDNGYQVQCMDKSDEGRIFGALIDYGGGPFEELLDQPTLAEVFNPTGEWNTVEVTCEGRFLSVRVNGALITMVEGISNSDGHIGIQGEKGLLEFRKIAVIKR
ncbi:MAG: 3-keto-disaccharide hydrolase [Verrucomicrobiia bacterium]|tara:strand:+ start:8934 stop:9545 length:612 start_codon:yes stop_codon:yes gene_type:complete